MRSGLSGESDETLMQRLQGGCAEALAELFGRHYRLVFTIARRILRDCGEAEDLMQEVFLEIYRDAGKYDTARGSVKTWLLLYAYHRSLNRKKYLSMRGFYSIPQRVLAEAPGRADGLNVQDWQSTIQAGMQRLNEKEWRTVEMACLEGFELREIAERMRESLGNTRNHYYRGLKKLRNFLFQDSRVLEEEAGHARR